MAFGVASRRIWNKRDILDGLKERVLLMNLRENYKN